jgi:hypothetical protein
MPIAMHGRTIALAGALLTLAAAAAPAAHADETLGLGQPATHDGVVTSFTLSGGPTQTGVRVRAVQALFGGGSASTGASSPVTVGPGAVVATSVPIAKGGTLELEGASGSPTLQASVEPDGDGDGYGDTTQDACPNDFTSHLRPCLGTETVGSPLVLAPDPRGFSGGGNPMEATQGAELLSLRAGVITHIRLRSAPAAGDTVVQVLRPNSDRSSYSVVAETAPVHAADDGVITLPESIAVQQFDTLAARSATGDLGAVAYVAGEALQTQQPPATATNHHAFTPGTSYADRRLLIQADVESDLDGDGRGDATQDHADLVLTGAAPATVGQGETTNQTLTVRNAGPDPAVKVVLSFGTSGNWPGALPAGVSCVSGSAYDGLSGSCTLDRLDPGASVTVTLSTPPSPTALPGTSIGTAARADAITNDPNLNNNGTLLSTQRAWSLVYSTPPQTGTQQPFVVVACGNVIKGTRDDDVVRGTLFGDRLVGGDGADLLKGGGGDDCLEGGAGNDVIDGDAGNDRLAGDAGADRLTGGNGDDRLTGGRGNDKLSGGNGKDIISPGAGKDTISAGPGNDTINSVDGVKETVDCGSGRDTVRADKRDHLIHCEKITRKR